MKYKFRAECIHDVAQFLIQSSKVIANLNTQQDNDGFRDVIVTFDSHLELSEIMDLIEKIEDGHVMCETVKPIEKYTGERTYKSKK